MNRSLRIVLTAASIVAVALFTTGCPNVCCNTARGGGSLAIEDGPGKSHQATFAFQLVCKPTDDPLAPKVSGQFEYQDHAAKDAKGKPMRVRIHGVATGVLPVEAAGCSSTQGVFTGSYRSQPEVAGEEPGTFYVSVVDNESPGVSGGDTFTLTLTGGPFNGYTAEGKLVAGGNIKVTPNETTTSGL